MKKNKKLIIIIAVAVVLVLAIVASILFAPKVKIDRSVIDENKPKVETVAKYLDDELVLVENEYTLIGESGNYQLYYNPTDIAIKLIDTSSGVEWSSMIDDSDYIHKSWDGVTENTETNRNKFKRLFEIGYTDFEAMNKVTSILEERADYSEVDVKLHKLENGIALETHFDLGLGLTIELWIDETGLNVKVPVDKVIEDEDTKYGFTSLSVLPMFGAMTDDSENSFLVFPDSTGGIYNVKSIPTTQRQSPITTDLYFSRDFDLDEVQLNNQQGVKNALMPFFGVGRNTSGFVGYITEGEMNSCVTLRPSGAVYYLNRIEPVINYRKSYSYLDPSGNEIVETEKNITAGDFAVHYSFVNAKEGSSVSYSDLANNLRSFLVESGRLVKTESTKEEGVNVNLQMLMSTKVDTMIGEFLKVMTKCDDIENFVKGLDDESQSKLRVLLLGWQSSGYNLYPSTDKLAGGIGNVKGLTKFLDEKGIDSYLVDDYVSATTDSKNFSKQSEAVYNAAKTPVTNTAGDQYVLNPYREYLSLTKKRIPYFNRKGVCGIGFDKIGWYVFDDYQKNVPVDRFDTTVIYATMLKEAKQAGLKTAVQRGNAYVLSATDYLYDIPKEGSSITLLDREIPFYQLVVHGYIPYSLDIPGNMAIDYNEEKLKWIETGAEPTFLLTQEMSEEFKDSRVGNAFSTEIETWSDDVTSLIKEFNTKLAFTGNCEMVEHTEIRYGVYRIGYSNGNKIYINYKNIDEIADDYTIPAKNYIVVNASGNIVE